MHGSRRPRTTGGGYSPPVPLGGSRQERRILPHQQRPGHSIPQQQLQRRPHIGQQRRDAFGPSPSRPAHGSASAIERRRQRPPGQAPPSRTNAVPEEMALIDCSDPRDQQYLHYAAYRHCVLSSEKNFFMIFYPEPNGASPEPIASAVSKHCVIGQDSMAFAQKSMILTGVKSPYIAQKAFEVIGIDERSIFVRREQENLDDVRLSIFQYCAENVTEKGGVYSLMAGDMMFFTVSDEDVTGGVLYLATKYTMKNNASTGFQLLFDGNKRHVFYGPRRLFLEFFSQTSQSANVPVELENGESSELECVKNALEEVTAQRNKGFSRMREMSEKKDRMEFQLACEKKAHDGTRQSLAEKNAELDEKDEMIAREKKDHAATKRILEMDRKNTHPTAVSPLARAPNHTKAAAVNADTTPKKNENSRDAVEAVMDLATHGDRSNAEAIEKNANDSLPTTAPSPNHFHTHTQAGKLDALVVAENKVRQGTTDKTGGTHSATVAATSPHLGSPPISSHASTRKEVTPLVRYPSLPSMATEPSTVGATAANAFNDANSTFEEFSNNWEDEDDEEVEAASALDQDAVDNQSRLYDVPDEENQSSKDIMGLLNDMHATEKACDQPQSSSAAFLCSHYHASDETEVQTNSRSVLSW